MGFDKDTVYPLTKDRKLSVLGQDDLRPEPEETVEMSDIEIDFVKKR